MLIAKDKDTKYERLNSYVRNIQNKIGATASATYVIQNEIVVNENYFGYHSSKPSSREVQADSQFNVGSVRKTYIALALSLAIYEGKIVSIDDDVTLYLSNCDSEVVQGTKIRHLLTHTHGLAMKDNRIIRIFESGTDWKYNNIGINLLVNIIETTMEKSVAEILQEKVFIPYEFHETGWRTKNNEKLIYNVYEESDILGPNDSKKGDQSNLFVSARDLALWGLLHLTKGKINGVQKLSQKVFDPINSIQTPASLNSNLPRHSFIWWVHDERVPFSEIGEGIPKHSFQSLGITGCACLVIPKNNVVAVRMYNQVKKVQNYDYLRDIKDFGNLVMECIE